mmetsp:Transcript_12100/g.25049  ORF Transcript_12100/g.25049 Transcript_12100/m.25049 type:complete len:106 (-) Transcript_12100:391-708(-)
MLPVQDFGMHHPPRLKRYLSIVSDFGDVAGVEILVPASLDQIHAANTASLHRQYTDERSQNPKIATYASSIVSNCASYAAVDTPCDFFHSLKATEEGYGQKLRRP